MPPALKEFFAQIAGFWAGLSNAKRVALVFLTVLGLSAAVAVPILTNDTRMVPLYSNMEEEDAAKVVAKLDSQQVPYELRGTTILVPEDRVPKLRLEMAAEGLPKGSSIGFELFDKSQFGATEFEQQVNLKRALEGELSRSIATVDGVESARVHLVLPRGSAFLSKKEATSASVVVKLKNPALFGKKEVAAVVHLVAAAVPGLTRNRISVVSTEGLTLHRPTSDEAGVGTEALAEESRSVEGQLEAKALAQLERVVGPGGADVRVAVVLDPSTKEQTKETYQPDRTALRSEQQNEEEIRSQSPGAQGIPGARTNLPDGDGGSETQATAAQNLDTTTRRSHTRNWEVDRAVEKIHTPPGHMARLSVAVLLDGTWVKQKGGGETFVPRPQAEVDQLAQVVRQAVGFDELRGDTISVSAAKFARESMPDETNVELVTPWWKKPLVLLALAGAVLLAVLLAVVLVWRKKKKEKKALEAAALAHQLELESVRAAMPLGATTEDAEAALAGGVDPQKLLSEGPEQLAELRQRALEIAQKDPQTTAVVLRGFLEESSSDEKAA